MGDSTLYKIRIANTGTAPDRNVKLVAEFTHQILPLSAAGVTSSVVSGQKVVFSPYEVLEAQQALEFSIQCQAKDLGDGRIRVQLTSDTLSKPLIEEESTFIY